MNEETADHEDPNEPSPVIGNEINGYVAKALKGAISEFRIELVGDDEWELTIRWKASR